MPRIHGASRPVTIGCFCYSFQVRLTSASNTGCSWDPCITPEYRWILPLCNLIIWEHTVHRCLLELYMSVGLMCQAIESTQSSKPICPFPPPVWRQGPSISGWSLHDLIFVTAKQKSLHHGQKSSQTIYSAQQTLEQSFSWMDAFWLLFFLAVPVPELLVSR